MEEAAKGVSTGKIAIPMTVYYLFGFCTLSNLFIACMQAMEMCSSVWLQWTNQTGVRLRIARCQVNAERDFSRQLH